ncbi:LodA/GoxA family CTQ-dependent oxidase [Catenuloplanes japonicus]|uniref:LodA/GoxA family CTQ-dependent oxidase n=1 Tax=Catenuloplanes japonicus TaxID=33876 RepID=UPI000B06B873|nr:LodA/GoxA family CTQ-dependent oxidase [Catenuloplanes japonicus]
MTENPARQLEDLFIGAVQAARTRTGPPPAERAVFRKLHGAAHGELIPRPDLPARWQTGIFAAARLTAWVRFSSDAAPTDPDLGSTLGIGVKLFGVPETDTADLIMQNGPRFFVDDATEMAAFTEAGVIRHDYPGYLDTHPVTREVLHELTAPRGSVLTSTYWAILPFHLGEDIVKYRLEPQTAPQDVPDDGTDYLAVDLASRLARDEYRFTLSVQLRTAPDRMPLDQATVLWPEDLSAYMPIADLVLDRQDVNARGQADYGQALAFNIGRVPHANRPCAESSLAQARQTVYAAGAQLRHLANGQPIEDAAQPRPGELPVQTPDETIVQAVIHPAIGVARVGSSDEYFHGPEVPYPDPLPQGGYRDGTKRLKRQAARFRIYGANARGDLVRELTGDGDGADIAWTVELANTKAAWYGFQLALDIPEAAYAPPTTLRNPDVADREALAIRPGPRTAHGRSAPAARFDDGSFMGTKVYLGEISTDAGQRLTVLGGHGHSASAYDRPAITFANNEGWHDDVADGPVTATVTWQGTELPVVPAWVVVAPPNYGPQRKSVRTMWDLMRDVAVTAGTLPAPARPSFTHDILPLFERLAGLQWVNAGYAAGFGWQGTFDLTTPDVLARLSDAGPATREQRRVIANNFRDLARDGASAVPWPWQYGDAMAIPPAPTPRQNAALSTLQKRMLDQWATGEFVEDWDPSAAPPRRIDDVPVAEQGDLLTRAALEFCLADAFHPGCEMTWPVRAASIYQAPFRFRHAPADLAEPPLGEILTPDAVTIPAGPLYGQAPGGITRWMAVPWQTDTSSCRSGYESAYDPYSPSFWPARVPNEVLSPANYDIVMDTTRPLEERRKAFANREAWIEPLGSDSYTAQINNMVRHFDFMAVVEPRPGPDDGHFPETVEVADHVHPALLSQGPRRSARDVDLSRIDLVNRFPNGLPPQVR